ncbi:hypothetical protein ILUMI_00196 [Ignelater luminosus]|uniref:Uncharacterized protein n=1 Tax=Ignelater luminosus TaxID=2038154 RepID=A0A8K0DT30_IGNLU|nr:hypothetical protein ILUMI_00196 [Ignelater luminosus]
MNNRGKHIVWLALNLRFRNRIKQIKKTNFRTYNYSDDGNFDNQDADYFPSEQTESDSDELMKPFEKPKFCILSEVTIHQKYKSNEPYLEPHVDNANNVIQANKDQNVKKPTAVTSTDTEQHMQAVLVDIINMEVQKSERKLYTKQGELRKRRKFDESPTERKKIEKEQYINNHKVKVNGIFNSKFTKALFTKPVRRTEYRGISQDRKTNLRDKLKSYIPPTRLKFWEELPVSASIGDNDNL